MISPNIITEISTKEKIGWSVIEKDYFLTLILDGIAHDADLQGMLVFKGGTALRKIYFKDYRYSEDLDFTPKKPLSMDAIQKAMERVFEYLIKVYNTDFRVTSFYSRKWFTDVKIQFMGLKKRKNTLTLDLMSDEILVDRVREENVINPYYPRSFSIPVYSLEEILAEKLRSFLQRTRVRDYYDAWYILKHAKNNIDREKIKEIFTKKVAYKKLSFFGGSQFFDKNKIEQAKAYYQQQIGHQVKGLPPFDDMISELRTALEIFFNMPTIKT